MICLKDLRSKFFRFSADQSRVYLKTDICQVSYNDIHVPKEEIKTTTEIPYALHVP